MRLTLRYAVTCFSNPEKAFEFFKQIRWPKGVRCPRCEECYAKSQVHANGLENFGRF
jgi:hypothetical protein